MIITKEVLSDLYLEKEKSPRQIAIILGFHFSTIWKYLNSFGIVLRTRSKACSVRAKEQYANGEKINPMQGKYHKKETKDKISKANQGKMGWNKGVSRSATTKLKISQSRTGKHYPKLSKACKGRVPWNRGISHSIATKIKIGNANRGENSGRWKGGISFEPYPFNFNKELKELIRKRDNYKCQVCSCPQIENMRKLDIHHKDYDKDNLNPKNLISLCRRCHTKTNSNREKWIKLFEIT